jgi:hypothetical protein
MSVRGTGEMRRLIAYRFAALALVNVLIIYHLYVYYVLGHTAVGCVDLHPHLSPEGGTL